MSCSFTEKISSLIDGELSPAEAREVEHHLLMCAQCEEARADFLSLRNQITSFAATRPAAVQNRALAKILASGERQKFQPAFGWGWKLGAGALALASFAIIALMISLIRVEPPPTPVAIKTPAPVLLPSPAPTPSPEVEQPKTETPRSVKPATPPRRTAPVREPKPGEQFAAVPEKVRPADAQTMTAVHFEKAETLLRAFRNVRLNEPGSATEVSYERKRAKQLVYQNMILRREADAAGDVQIASLLESLEPILLDIANLPDQPDDDSVRVIRERVERKNIVALLQINSTALARALD